MHGCWSEKEKMVCCQQVEVTSQRAIEYETKLKMNESLNQMHLSIR